MGTYVQFLVLSYGQQLVRRKKGAHPCWSSINPRGQKVARDLSNQYFEDELKIPWIPNSVRSGSAFNLQSVEIKNLGPKSRIKTVGPAYMDRADSQTTLHRTTSDRNVAMASIPYTLAISPPYRHWFVRNAGIAPRNPSFWKISSAGGSFG